MKTVFYLLALAVLFNGCTEFSFQTEESAPLTEHDKLVRAQQQALLQQQQTTLNE